VGRLQVTLQDGTVKTFIDENLEEYDITEMLQFSEEDIENLLLTHAAIQAYWEALALKRKVVLDDYKDIWSRKWWAHNKVFAKHVLTAYGYKNPTIDAVKDQVILVYSEETSEAERDKFSSLAWSVASKGKLFADSEEEFKSKMFKYLNFDPPWYFESVERTLKQMKENFGIINIVAEKLNARAFHMKSVQDLVLAKKWNVGPKVVTEAEVMQRINKGDQNGRV